MNANTTTYEVNIDDPSNLTDEALTVLWHMCEDNPVPLDAPRAHTFAEHIGREIIQRWLLTASPVKPTPSAENVCVTKEEHSRNEFDRATARALSSFAKLATAESDVNDVVIYLKAAAEVELLTTVSELNAKTPSFESAYKSASKALGAIGSLHNMGTTIDFIFGANPCRRDVGLSTTTDPKKHRFEGTTQ